MSKQISIELRKKIYIIIAALIGFFTTIKLAFIYYDSNFNPYALPSFCSINQYVDCDGVAQTVHSQFLGIPLAYWGMGLYLFILFLLFVDKLKNIKLLNFLEVFKNPNSYIASLGFISFAISMILAGVSVFEIKKICILCVCTYFLNLAIAVIATDTENGFWKGFIASFKNSFWDFVAAVKIKKYLIALISLGLVASAVLAYTTLSYCFTPQVKRVKELKAYDDMKTDNPYKVEGNVLGDKDGKLIVYIYTDYRCPVCRIYNVITHRAASELSGFKMVHKNLPLDNECNPNVRTKFHEGSCMMARYAIAAEDQNHFWDFNSALFETQPKDEDAVLKLAKKLGLNTIQLREDANSSKTKERVRDEIESATELNIDGTPSLVINEKVYTGLKTFYDLKDLLIKAGASVRTESK